MPVDLYRCSCGKTFRTAQGLAGHKRFCEKAVDQPAAKKVVDQWEQKFSKLDQDFRALSRQHADTLAKLKDLEGNVNLLIGYVCPGGKNVVGVHSTRIMEMAQQINDAKKEMVEGQVAVAKEVKAYINAVLGK